MNIRRACQDLLHGSDLEQLADLQAEVPRLGKNIDLLFGLKRVPTVNARAAEHLKRAAKSMLMNRRGRFKPQINVNVKAKSRKNGERRIGETRSKVALAGQFILTKCPFENLIDRGF